MKTLFALHCITKRNINDNFYNQELENLGYDETTLPNSELPSENDYATGQVDESLIEKGRFQALFLAKQIQELDWRIKRIYCGNQKRCKETAQIIANNLNYPCTIIVDERINARGYGEIAEKAMDTDKIKHFWKHKDIIMDIENMKLVALYLVSPEKIGAETKKSFNERVKNFIFDQNNNFNESLIIAGSDTWKKIKKDNFFYLYKNEESCELRRGQLACVDFTKQKTSNLRK